MPHKHDDYNYFENSKFKDSIGKVLPSFIVSIELEPISRQGTYTRFGCDMAIWFQDNGGIDDITYIQYSRGWHIIFTNEKKARKFNRWYKKYDCPDGYTTIDLWLTYHDFKETIDRDGTVVISNSVKYNLESSLYANTRDDGYLSEITYKLFDLYKWMVKNIDGKVWHWNGNFRFELEEDAVTFKLYNTPKETDDA